MYKLLNGQMSSTHSEEGNAAIQRDERTREGNTEFNMLRNIDSKNLNIISYGISKVQIKTR